MGEELGTHVWAAWNLPKILSFRAGILGGARAELWKAAEARGRRGPLARALQEEVFQKSRCYGSGYFGSLVCF